MAAVSGFPRPQGPEGPLPIPREGSYGPDQYFQYINKVSTNILQYMEYMLTLFRERQINQLREE